MEHRQIRFGQNLKKFQASRNLTRKSFANLIGYNPCTVSAWVQEKNIPPLEAIVLIAQFFNVTLDELVLGNPDSSKLEDDEEKSFGQIRFGQNLKKLRNAKNLTQKSFAHLIGYSPCIVSAWENKGQTSPLEAIVLIAQFFNVTLDEMVFGKPDSSKLEDDEEKSFGQNLKKLRNAKNLTQKSFANLIGYNPCTVSAWEKGKKSPTLKTVLLLAQFFNVTLDEMVFGKPVA